MTSFYFLPTSLSSFFLKHFSLHLPLFPQKQKQGAGGDKPKESLKSALLSVLSLGRCRQSFSLAPGLRPALSASWGCSVAIVKRPSKISYSNRKKRGKKNPLHVCLSIRPGKSHLVPSLAKLRCYQSQLVSPRLPG